MARKKSSPLLHLVRSRRENGPAGTDGQASGGEQLIDMGCPDCRGVLGVSDLGQHGLLWFRCLVGHAFSSESLMQAKEEQLEGALWTAIELFREVAMLYGEMAARGQRERGRDLARGYRQRAELALKHEAEIRRITSSDGPARAARGR